MYTYFIWCDHVTFVDPFNEFDVTFFPGSFSFRGPCVLTVLCLFSLWDVLLSCLCLSVFSITNKPQ